MKPGAAGDDVGETRSAEERCVVVFYGTRQHARVFGSVMGPTVLAPGPSEAGWQVLNTLPGCVPGEAIARTIRFASEPASFGLDEPPAFSLCRTGSTRRIILPVAPTTSWSWTWYERSRVTADHDQIDLEKLVSHLAAMAPEVSHDNVRAALRDERGGGEPLYELAALLGLPTAAVDMLEVGASEVPKLGQPLLRSDKKRHARDLVAAQLDQRKEPRASDALAMRVGHDPVNRLSDRLFGATFLVLGVLAVMMGALYLLLGLRPAKSLLGLDHPAAWVVLGMAISWYGRYRWRRETRRPVEIPKD